MKTVIVLLATFNGIRWLSDQVESILAQQEVNVRLVISDDFSTDQSWEWLQALALRKSQVVLLPRTKKFGGAAKNFYHLLQNVKITDADFFAYADQDDIWETDKLIRQIKLLASEKYAAVSSDVIAFWPNGKTTKIIKSQPQRQLDFLFESAGPGCTFLMTPWLVGELQRLLNVPELNVQDIALHDWFTYAVCRASNKSWLIDHYPTVQYRQHAHNELGANKGIKAVKYRVKRVCAGWYYEEVLKIAQVCEYLSRQEYLQVFCRALKDKSWLGKYVTQCRRRVRDRLILIIIFCFWQWQKK
jgi:rhamnosyltransferase